MSCTTLIAALAACGPVTENENAATVPSGMVPAEPPVEPPIVSVEGERGERQGWKVTSFVDPLTDQTVFVARRSIAAASFNFDVEVACYGSDVVRYSITAFGENAEAVPFHWSYGSQGPEVRLWIRIDGQPAYQGAARGQRYSNQFSFIGEEHARGQSLILRFGLKTDDATISLDQSSRAFRSVVDSCLLKETDPRPQTVIDADSTERSRDAEVPPETEEYAPAENESPDDGEPL